MDWRTTVIRVLISLQGAMSGGHMLLRLRRKAALSWATVPWGRWHFLRHWLDLSGVNWFECHHPETGRWTILGRCVECNRVIDSW